MIYFQLFYNNCLILVDLLATSGDITLTWTSPVFPKLLKSEQNDENPFGRPLTSDEESWIGSFLDMGAIIGPFPFGFLADKFGRKIGLLAIAVPHIVSYLILAFARIPELYYAARFIAGMALGGGYAVLPMYISEVAEDSNRGTLCNTVNIFWTFGNLIPYVIGPYIPIMYFNIILACIPTSFFVLFLIFGPETPYYHLQKNNEDAAKTSLMRLRADNEKKVELEMTQMKSGLEKEERGNFRDLFKSRVTLKALGISIALIMSQQLSGIDAIFFYTERIFTNAGIEDLMPPEISAIILGCISFLSSFIAPALADRSGRRFLLLTSSAGCGIAHICSGIFFYFKDHTDYDTTGVAWLSILFMILYITSFSIGLCCVPWTITSELLPTNVKAYGASLVAAISWGTSFIITKFYNNMSTDMGLAGTFWFFGSFCVLAFIFIFFLVPETKGKSFEEIQVALKDKEK